ncbi:hypothetical protein VTH82DRAFT_7811 [Thermothelomyces myriococcoides]
MGGHLDAHQRLSIFISPNDPLPAIVSQAQENLTSILQARALHASRDAAVTGRLAGVADRADRLLALLGLVRDRPALHTSAVRARAHALMRLAADHASALMVMAADSMRGAREEEEEAAATAGEGGWWRRSSATSMPSRLGWSSLREGWWVDARELVEVAGQVREVLGCEMVLVEMLGDRLREGADEIIRLDDDDAAALGLPQTTVARVEQWRAGVS